MLNLINCNLNDYKHISFIKNLSNDITISKNVIGLWLPTKNEYIVSKDDIYVGAIKINKEQNDYYSIDIGIIEKYRNLGIGTYILKNITSFMNEINWQTILVRTSYTNDAAISSIKKAGFKLDYEEIEKCNNEGVDYTVFSITNDNYKKENIKIKQA